MACMAPRHLALALLLSCCVTPAALGQTTSSDPWSAVWGDFAPVTYSGRGSRTITLPAGAQHIVVRALPQPRNPALSRLFFDPSASFMRGPLGSETSLDARSGGTLAWGLSAPVTASSVKVHPLPASTRWTISIEPISRLPEVTGSLQGTGHGLGRYSGSSVNLRFRVGAFVKGEWADMEVVQIPAPGASTIAISAQAGHTPVAATGSFYDTGASVIEVGETSYGHVHRQPRWNLTVVP